jgi:putative DNA primase/helicase
MADATWINSPELRAEAERQSEIYREAILEVVDARPPAFSDEALALRFTEKHAEDTRYVAMWSKWLFWETAIWNVDVTLRAFDMSRTICRVASAEIDDQKQAKLASSIASAKTVAAVINLARADRRHAATVEQWDADLWSFNCHDG